jgi:invasion protein IalB
MLEIVSVSRYFHWRPPDILSPQLAATTLMACDRGAQPVIRQSARGREHLRKPRSRGNRMIFDRIKASVAQRGPFSGMALAGVAALSIACSAPASAQDGAPAAEGGADLGNWIKICTEDETDEGRESCLVTQEVRTDTGEFLASVSVRDNEGQETPKTLMVAVPPGTLLQPGLRVQVDEGEQEPGRYVICLPNACYAELEIEDSFVDEMKRGQNLVVSVINNQGQAVGIGLTLVGFTRGWDGDPVDTNLLAQERQRLQEQLQRRAADARQRLLQQQEGGESEEGGEQPQQ